MATTKSILKNSIDSSQEDQSRKTSVGSSEGDDNTSRRSSILSASGRSNVVMVVGFFRKGFKKGGKLNGKIT